MSEAQGEGNLLFTCWQYDLVYTGIVSDESSAQLADSTIGEIRA